MARWVKDNNDLSFIPENELRREAFDNPVEFGKANHDEISRLVDLADLSLQDFNTAKEKINVALSSPEYKDRYWSLIVCSSFGQEAMEFKDKARELSIKDENLLVRTRAAEFLALYGDVHPGEVLRDVLRKTEDDVEANLILNTVVLLMESEKQYNSNISEEMFKPEVLKGEYVVRRLKYILPLQKELEAAQAAGKKK